jgi:DNA polymerase III epsilon subunit-like protein
MDSLLRDLNREQGKMRDDVDNLFRHFEKLSNYVHEYIQQSTIEWAKLLLDHPRTLLLIVETTAMLNEQGYSMHGGENEPIRFTGLALASGEIWDQMLHPTHSMAVGGTEYHGLTMGDLEDKPRLADAWPEIAEKLQDRHIVIFNADWSRRAVRSIVQTHVLDGATCLHNRCKEYYNEFYELSLEKILGYLGIEKRRDELKDSKDRVLMLAQVVRNLAAGMKKQEPESDPLDDFSSLDEHPF